MTISETSAGSILQELNVRLWCKGIETHLFEAGPANARPLLYLHGTYSGQFMAGIIIPPLSQEFHFFAPDTPGFGLTQGS